MDVGDPEFAAREQFRGCLTAHGAAQLRWHSDRPFVRAGLAACSRPYRVDHQFGAFQHGPGTGQFEAEGQCVGDHPGELADLEPDRCDGYGALGPGGFFHLADDGHGDGHLVHGSPSCPCHYTGGLQPRPGWLADAARRVRHSVQPGA